MFYTKPLAKLVGELERLPGIGPKTAQRLAFHLLRAPKQEALSLSEAIAQAIESVRFCARCFNFTDQETCEICRNPRRDPSLVCVVEEPRDLIALEKTNEFKGVYHVLQGVISPMDGIGPEMLRIRELQQRVSEGGIKELILATNPTIEGDTTAMYLAGIFKPLGLKITRLAHGMPVGGDLDYADQATVIQALEWRREM